MNEQKPLNINTVLLTAVLAIAGWTLTRVVTLGESMATGSAQSTAQAAATVELRARIAAIEVQVQANKIEITRLVGASNGQNVFSNRN